MPLIRHAPRAHQATRLWARIAHRGNLPPTFAVLILLPALWLSNCCAAAQLELEWDPSPDSRAAGYRIHHGTVSGEYTHSIDAGNTTHVLVTGLEIGTTYYFTATAYDASGIRESPYSNEIYVRPLASRSPDQLQVVNFSTANRTGEAPFSVDFNNTTEGEITEWSWDFGDGATSNQSNPRHTYTEPGAYTVQLTVHGPGGTNSLLQANFITVEADATESPSAEDVPANETQTCLSETPDSERATSDFALTPWSGPAPLTVAFTDASSGCVANWLWDFDDGTTSDEPSPSHVFREPGHYMVTLTVVGTLADEQSSMSAEIHVSEAASNPSADSPHVDNGPPSERNPGEFAIDTGISGSWYDPRHDGEGFLIEILGAQTALVYWFTYDRFGNQAWIVGVGGVHGASIYIEDAIITEGARFGAAFDPGEVERTPWGHLRFDFDNCDAGTLTYAGPPDYGSGAQKLVRLTTVEETLCGHASGRNLVSAGRSGSYYDPRRNGEGFLVESLGSGLTLVYWFTYDGDGNQAWVVGVGNSIDGLIEITDTLAPVGARFGPAFDPETVERIPWGSLSLQLDSCSTGSIAYKNTATGESDEIELIRLTTLGDSTCP